MNCQYCKTKLFDNNRNCPSCGAPVVYEDDEEDNEISYTFSGGGGSSVFLQKITRIEIAGNNGYVGGGGGRLKTCICADGIYAVNPDGKCAGCGLPK